MQLQINEESLPVYEALASKTRIKIIQLLSKKKMNVKDLAKELGVSSAITTMHVKKLEEANIIKTEKVGQQKISSLVSIKSILVFQKKYSMLLIRKKHRYLLVTIQIMQLNQHAV